MAPRAWWSAIGFVFLCGCTIQPDYAPRPIAAPAAPADALRVFPGKVVLAGDDTTPAADRRLTLVSDDGTTYPLADDDISAMFRRYDQLRDCPVRISGQLVPGTNTLRVETVQTVRDGKVYAVDFWCEICQISHLAPGNCVCCGDDTELRERPVP